MNPPIDSPRTEDAQEPLMTEKQVCHLLNVSKRNLYCWRMAGYLPYFKIGKAVRFRRSEVLAALEQMRVGR